jgi:DNA topoisomerase-1
MHQQPHRHETIDNALQPAPRQSSRSASLRYVNDDTPGIQRQRLHGEFIYTGSDGRVIEDKALLSRIRTMAIPSAWEDVWICPWSNGHIQATGRDARQRKQYRYHPRWRNVRDELKFQRMISFAGALPQIRSSLEHDLRKPGLNRQKVLATVVCLLQATLMRIGKDEYAHLHQSFDLNTLHQRHADVESGNIKFHFRGKSGVQHTIRLQDPYLERIVKKLLDLPGQDLFEYIDEAGAIHAIGSTDVNHYLHDISGEDYTAKDFRTWAGTVLTALALDQCKQFDNQLQGRKNIEQAIEHVAKKLGNTPTICRRSYVHPDVIAAYLDGVTLGSLKVPARDRQIHDMHNLGSAEAAVLSLLQQEQGRQEKRRLT